MENSIQLNLPNCNLIITGKGLDINGNSIVKLKFPNSPNFSIQIGGNLFNHTNELLNGKINDENIDLVESEIVHYIINFGSTKQNKNLKLYSPKYTNINIMNHKP